MPFTKNNNKLYDKSKVDKKSSDTAHVSEDHTLKPKESHTYAVTVSKKSSTEIDKEGRLCSGQKSFISIHSTDHLCQLSEIQAPAIPQECNLEVLSLNEVFPSTSEESLLNDDDQTHKKQKNMKKSKNTAESAKNPYVPSNSKSSTGSGRQKEPVEAQTTGYSDFDIPKNTLYVIGSNPGEPKMSYPDPPKKISKTMKKLMRNMDKHKSEQNSISPDKGKFITRGILKDGRCGPECTGDSSVLGSEDSQVANPNNDDTTLHYQMDCGSHNYKATQNQDKNVKFNTQVVIIHFTGDICRQSVETLSKEKDQQARNSELRKTFLTKYNELWSTQK